MHERDRDGYVAGTTLPQKTLRALSEVDMMPGPLRQCVHEFGYPIVKACLFAGVKEPAAIRELVHQIWAGARHQNQKVTGLGTKTVNYLDWVLVQAGASINAERLLRLLWMKGLALVPREPTTAMIDASVAAIKDMGPLLRTKKHHLRLRAAISASTKHMWPHLLEGAPSDNSEAA